MSQMATDTSIVGRGNQDGAQLFRQWFEELGQVAENDVGAAFTRFDGGSDARRA